MRISILTTLELQFVFRAFISFTLCTKKYIKLHCFFSWAHNAKVFHNALVKTQKNLVLFSDFFQTKELV